MAAERSGAYDEMFTPEQQPRQSYGQVAEALRELSLADVTAAFRTKAKQLHPDANNGDRGSEPELRRMLEAYQFLKEYLSLSNTEPMRPPDRPYSPAE